MTEVQTNDFSMDPNLLVSVIKQQASSKPKALTEGIMNSIDAGATRVDVTLTTTTFKIVDNGRGFSSEEEIRLMFGRFGTPHKEGDAIYGRFRMGRGQMMAAGVMVWKSGRFQMTVDIDNKGLSYDLEILEEPVSGCIIEATLYKPMQEWELRSTLKELKQYVAYTPRPVYVNGELYGNDPSNESDWSFEDELAYYKLMPASNMLKVYNLGVFVEEIYTSYIGMGGIVVSKKALQVNFARNNVMRESCEVWKTVKKSIDELVMSKLSMSEGLTDNEREYLANHLEDLRTHPTLKWQSVKVLTDASGKHLPLSALRGFKRFVYVEKNLGLGMAVQGVDGTFAVTEELLNRFSTSSLSGFIDHLRKLGSELLHPNLEVISVDSIAEMGLGGAKQVNEEGLTRKEAAAFATLKLLNDTLAKRLYVMHGVEARELRIGTHKGNQFPAWTDGKFYITANRKFLKQLQQGVDGVHEWLLTLVHEYTHDTDDSESHSHSEVFYRKFHDTAFAGLNLASLARVGAREYLNQLKARAVPRPRSLMKALSA